ncbi:MAG: hypothetical protein Q9207_001824 [Kuettlingeria erythrocarpa]
MLSIGQGQLVQNPYGQLTLHKLSEPIDVLRGGDGGPEKATRVSNLIARFLEAPVLHRKPAILLFLHGLAEDLSMDVTSPDSDNLHGGLSHRNGNGKTKNPGQPRVFEEAFSLNGLPLLPTHEERVKQNRAVGGTGSQRHPARKEPLDDIPGNDQPDASDTTGEEKPTEATILHDLPFTLQGLSSTHLPFSSRSTLDFPTTLPLPMISLLHTLAEPSLLYRSLSDFVESRDEGLVGQSLRSAIGTELRSYLGLIATLEAEIRRAIASGNIKGPRGGIGKAGVTLKRCVVWTREATMGLRLMSLMAEEAKSEFAS